MNGYDPAAIQAMNQQRAAMQQQQMQPGQQMMPMQGQYPGQQMMPMQGQQMPMHMQGEAAWTTVHGGRGVVPTGGAVAKSFKINPYMNPQTGRFSKPTQADIIREILFFCNINPNGAQVKRVDDVGDAGQPIRHVCTEAPYLHPLHLMVYPVTMLDFEAQIQFYAHPICSKVLIYRDSMP